MRPDGGCYDLGDLIYQEMARRCWAIAKRQPVAQLEELES